MIKKLLVTKVFINHESKDGKPFITEKTKKKFWKIAIQVDEKEYAGEYLSSLIFNEDDNLFNLKPGHTLSFIVNRNGNYINFKMPTQIDYLEERIEVLENIINDGKLPHEPKAEGRILGADDLGGIDVDSINF
ncbi:MAG: hypothetical protein AABY22_21745 [Nanoarchaeota archaeon]